MIFNRSTELVSALLWLLFLIVLVCIFNGLMGRIKSYRLPLIKWFISVFPWMHCQNIPRVNFIKFPEDTKQTRDKVNVSWLCTKREPLHSITIEYCRSHLTTSKTNIFHDLNVDISFCGTNWWNEYLRNFTIIFASSERSSAASDILNTSAE